MNTINSIVIEGIITEDVLMDKSVQERPVARFEIDATRAYRNAAGEEKTEVSTFPVVAYGTVAGILAGGMGCKARGKKGRGVRVVGRLKLDKWTDKEGKECSEIVIIAEHVEFKPECSSFEH